MSMLRNSKNQRMVLLRTPFLTLLCVLPCVMVSSTIVHASTTMSHTSIAYYKYIGIVGRRGMGHSCRGAVVSVMSGRMVCLLVGHNILQIHWHRRSSWHTSLMSGCGCVSFSRSLHITNILASSVVAAWVTHVGVQLCRSCRGAWFVF